MNKLPNKEAQNPCAVDSIPSLSFEQALKELENIVRRLESGSQDLDSSIQDYVTGTALKEHCQNKLAAAKLKVEAIVKNAGGAVATEPFDAE